MINYETPRRAFLEYIVFVLFKRRWLILWGFLAVFLSFFLAVKITYPVYKGTSKVWIHRTSTQDVGLFPDIQHPSITPSIMSPAYNWSEVLSGQSTAMEVVRQFHLDDLYRQRALNPQDFREYFWYYFKQVIFSPIRLLVILGLISPGEQDFFASATGKVSDEIIKSELANQMSDVLAISAYGPTPQLAQDIANYLTEKLIVLVVKGEQNAAHFAMDFAKNQLDDISGKLNAAEDSLLSYEKRLEILDLDSQKKAMISQTDSMEAKLLDSQRSQEELKEKVETLNNQIEEQKSAFVSATIVQKDILDLHGLVQSLNGSMESIKVLQDQYRSLQQRSAELVEAESIHSKLSREIDIYSKIWSLFQDKMAKLDIETVSRLKEISMEIVDPAYLPKSAGPIWPKSVILYIVAGILGLITGLAFAFIVEYYNDSLRNSVEAEKELNIPVIASIPEFHLQNRL